VFPVPFDELTAPLVLLYVPAAGALTLILTVQVPPAAIVPPVKVIDDAPTTGANVGEPQPLVEAPVGLATTIWLPPGLGNVSLNATALWVALESGLVIVNVRMDVSAAMIGFGEKDLLMLGGGGEIVTEFEQLLLASFPSAIKLFGSAVH
jgi:hypothetical protein